jgi:hypothetical protein
MKKTKLLNVFLLFFEIGDLVQIITANMHNRFLVHREANEHQPAAEGWIPGFVIGFQSTNQSNLTN